MDFIREKILYHNLTKVDTSKQVDEMQRIIRKETKKTSDKAIEARVKIVRGTTFRIAKAMGAIHN